MAINFPTSLDDLANVSAGNTITPAHKNDLNDIVEALEAKVGIDSSAVATSHDYLLLNLPAQAVDWDAGAIEIRAQTFESDVTTGTIPLVIASTTKCTNLNADQVDGKDLDGSDGAGEITTNDGTQTLTNKTLTSVDSNTPDIDGGTVDAITSLTVANAVDIGAYNLTALSFTSDVAEGTAPFVVTSTSLVSNLNAEELNSQVGSHYLDVDNMAAGTLATARGGLNLDTSGTAQGSLIYYSASGVAAALGVGTDGQFLKTQGAGANPTWDDAPSGAFEFKESSTFSGATSVSITETMSAGETFMVVIEGNRDNTNVYRPVLRVNAASGGTDYEYYATGNYNDGSEKLLVENSANADGLYPTGIANDWVNGVGNTFFLKIFYTVRNSDTQIYVEHYFRKPGSEAFLTRVSGSYKSGTPTAVSMERATGTGAISGTYYVYKLKTS